jgi:hypothetical protein
LVDALRGHIYRQEARFTRGEGLTPGRERIGG